MNATQQWQSTEILKLFKNKTIQWISWYKCLEKSEEGRVQVYQPEHCQSAHPYGASRGAP